MRRLDEALSKLNSPSFIGQQVKNLPCDLCGKAHTKAKAVRVDTFLVWEIHSPCLDKLARLAVKRTG